MILVDFLLPNDRDPDGRKASDLLDPDPQHWSKLSVLKVTQILPKLLCSSRVSLANFDTVWYLRTYIFYFVNNLHF